MNGSDRRISALTSPPKKSVRRAKGIPCHYSAPRPSGRKAPKRREKGKIVVSESIPRRAAEEIARSPSRPRGKRLNPIGVRCPSNTKQNDCAKPLVSRNAESQPSRWEMQEQLPQQSRWSPVVHPFTKLPHGETASGQPAQIDRFHRRRRQPVGETPETYFRAGNREPNKSTPRMPKTFG